MRPALWLTGLDPRLPPGATAGVDDTIVVEITIDARGNIVDKTVLHSLGSLIDSTVLNALASWRFLPARRDGVPIASKQDVHFHFGGKQGS